MSSSANTSTSNRQVLTRAAATTAASPTAAPAQATKRAVDAVVRYVQAPPNGETAYQYVYGPPEGQKATNIERMEHTVSITDLRSVPQDFTLENNGFQLHRLQVPDDINWDDEQQVHSRYYPLVEKLLLEVTGGSRVHIFDHTLRQGKIQQGKEFKPDQAGKRRGPVPSVHVDYTPTSGITRLDELLPEEADRLRETPFAVIQVWRPLRGPVQDSPLAMIDASTVAKEDLQESKLYFQGRTGTVYGVKHNPEHKFYFAKGMITEEAYVFVCYHSREGRARFTPHTGFADPTVPADAPPRESVESRAYVFWEHEPKQPYAPRS